MRTWTPQFGLYDFFSVLLPGVVLLLGLFPFFPTQVDLGSVGTLLPLLAGGYVAGQFLHISAVEIEDRLPRVVSHREQFEQELTDPTSVTREVVHVFVKRCADEFEHVNPIPASRSDGAGDRGTSRVLRERDIDTVYTSVRAKLFSENAGRSETFQAVFAFHRSIWVASLLLTVAYLWYALLTAGLVPTPGSFDLLPYRPKITDISDVGEGALLLNVFVLVSISYLTFNTAKEKYRTYYVTYLLTDYIRLSTENSEQKPADTQ